MSELPVRLRFGFPSDLGEMYQRLGRLNKIDFESPGRSKIAQEVFQSNLGSQNQEIIGSWIPKIEIPTFKLFQALELRLKHRWLDSEFRAQTRKMIHDFLFDL